MFRSKESILQFMTITVGTPRIGNILFSLNYDANVIYGSRYVAEFLIYHLILYIVIPILTSQYITANHHIPLKAFYKLLTQYPLF